MLFSSLYTARLDEEIGTDDNSILFTVTRRKAAVNQGMAQFAELTECFERTSTITIIGGTAEYNLNSVTNMPSLDFVRFSKQQVEFRYVDASSFLTVLAGDDLVRRDVDWLNRYQPNWQVSTVASNIMQWPSVYYERMDGGARFLGFWPTPSTGSSASATVVVPYLARPTPMTSDTSEPFQVGASPRIDLRDYHQALVHFAAHQLEKLRRDEAASDRQLQKFLGYVTRWLQNHRIKGGLSLTMARNYFKTRSKAAQDPRV